MNYSSLIKSTIDLTTCLFMASLLVASLFKSVKKYRSEQYLREICVLLMIMLISDAGYSWAIGSDEAKLSGITMVAGYTLQYACAIIMPFVYMNYVAYIVILPDFYKKRLRVFSWIGILIGEILVMLCVVPGIADRVIEGVQTDNGQYLPIAHGYMLLSYVVYFVFVLSLRPRLELISFIIILVSFFLPGVFALTQRGNLFLPLIFASMALSTFLIYFTVKIENERRIANLQKELSQLQVDIMLSQIQPHFLYNSLTTIAALCDKNPVMAKNATDDFANYFKNTIQSIKSTEPISFNEEIEHTKHYFALEKLRFGEAISLEFDMQVTDFRIPPLTVQPIVENAIKYGICSEPDRKGSILIKTRYNKNSYVVTIADNGCGFDLNLKKEDGRQHVGLENVRKRVESTPGGKFTVSSEKGVGTTVVICLGEI